MHILCISGSASKNSSNTQLLLKLAEIYGNAFTFNIYDQLRNLPLFRPEDLSGELPVAIQSFKEAIHQADAVIICTPEYVHNIPAVLKNMFEWFSASGEFDRKKVIALTLTPHPPRGEYAMNSLIQSLTSLNATILSQLDCYKTDLFDSGKVHISSDQQILFDALFEII